MDNTPYATPLDFAIKALKNLQPGETYIYFTGFLESERLNNPLGENSRLADFAYSLMEDGKITLLQQRLTFPVNRLGKVDWREGIGRGFHYIAVGVQQKNRKPNITFNQIAREHRR